MSGLQIEISIDEKDVKQFAQTRSKIEAATVRMTGRLLDTLEAATFIKTYTQTAGPRKPEGSTYRRTFRLQRSSEKQITRNTFPVEGRWEAKADYASRVIGLAAQQAPIHAGRWPILEGPINRVNFIAQSVFDEEMAKEKL